MFPSYLLPPPALPWYGVHPLLAHFPIALLLVAPLFVLLGFLPKIGRGFALSGLVLLALGTVAAYVAADAGKAAADLVEGTAEVSRVLEQHERLGDSVPVIYAILTVAYAFVLFGPALLLKTDLLKQRLPRAVPWMAQIAVLVALLTCGLVVANASALGGRLVHELGVKAWTGGH